MTNSTNDLDLLRAHDPAAGVDPDPSSMTGQAIRHRIVTASGENPAPASRGSGRRRFLVATVATLSVATGAAAVAQIGPFANEWDACHEAPGEAGRNVPYPECADFVTDRVLAETDADGSKFEREVLSDGQVTRDEYREAAQRTAACIQDALTQAGVPEASATAELETLSDLGPSYMFKIKYPEGFDSSTLPWRQDDVAADGEATQQATRLTDDMVQRDPMSRCPAEHFDRIHRVWEAQQIAAQ